MFKQYLDNAETEAARIRSTTTDDNELANLSNELFFLKSKISLLEMLWEKRTRSLSEAGALYENTQFKAIFDKIFGEESEYIKRAEETVKQFKEGIKTKNVLG